MAAIATALFSVAAIYPRSLRESPLFPLSRSQSVEIIQSGRLFFGCIINIYVYIYIKKQPVNLLGTTVRLKWSQSSESAAECSGSEKCGKRREFDALDT